MKIYLTGSLAKYVSSRKINDIDIIIKIDKKPIKKFPQHICNINYKSSSILKKIYKRYINSLELGIDIFITHDFKHYFQLLEDGNIEYWGTALKIIGKKLLYEN